MAIALLAKIVDLQRSEECKSVCIMTGLGDKLKFPTKFPNHEQYPTDIFKRALIFKLEFDLRLSIEHKLIL